MSRLAVPNWGLLTLKPNLAVVHPTHARMPTAVARATPWTGVIFGVGFASLAKKPSSATDTAPRANPEMCSQRGRSGTAASAAPAADKAPKIVVSGFFTRGVYTVGIVLQEVF
jgi:hypothetical protein